jgi:polysaccharide biosynthesis transport protein
MGYLVAERLPPTYESEVRLLVGPVSADRDTLQAAGQQAQNYAAVTTTATIIVPAARELQMSPDEVKSTIQDVTASDVTRFLSIRIHDGDRNRAALIANELAAQLIAYSREAVRPQPTEPVQTLPGQLRVMEAATPAAEGIGPSAQLIVPLAALAGLLGALGLAVVVDGLSNVVRNEQELAALAPVAVLGSINGTRPRFSKRPFVVEADPDSRAAAAYRLLATKIELSNGDKAPKSVLLLDAHGGRSSGWLAVNLAGALAESGAQVALIDHGNKRDLEKVFGFSSDSKPGGGSGGQPVRVDRVTLDRFPIGGSLVTVFRPRAPFELLELDQAGEVLKRVLADADVAILTAPPVDSSPHSLIWSSTAEATVLVAERDHTQRAHVPAALETLRHAGGNVIGIVLCRDRAF